MELLAGGVELLRTVEPHRADRVVCVFTSSGERSYTSDASGHPSLFEYVA